MGVKYSVSQTVDTLPPTLDTSIKELRERYYSVLFRTGSQLALQCVYGILMIDLLSGRMRHNEYAQEVLKLNEYRVKVSEVEQGLSTERVYGLVSIIGILLEFRDIKDSTIIHTIKQACWQIKNSAVNRILVSKVIGKWPTLKKWITPIPVLPDFFEWLEEVAYVIENERYTSAFEREFVCSFFGLFLFVQYRACYKELVRFNSLLPMIEELITQCDEFERLLIHTPLPDDDLNLSKLAKNIQEMEGLMEKHPYPLIRLQQMVGRGTRCRETVENYLSFIKVKVI